MPINTDFVFRILTAFVLGILIGTEREYSHHMAGVRTNALVSAGACMFVLFGMLTPEGDKTRIAAQVATGIGFLGGGVIVRDGFTIKGLTTAATLWCTAAVGVMAGGGHLLEAAACTALVLITNAALRPLSERIGRLRPITSQKRWYRMTVECQADEAQRLRITLSRLAEMSKLQLVGMETGQEHAQDMERWFITMQSEIDNDREVEHMLATILTEPGVLGASWDVVARNQETG